MSFYGDLFEAGQRKEFFVASNQAAQAVSVALATTYTGICLSNDAGATKKLVLKRAAFALTVAPAAIASLHLIGGSGAVTHTTPLTPESTVIGSGASAVGKADSAATIPTPRYLFSLANGFTAAALPGFTMADFEFKGEWVIPPGGFIAIGALTAVTGFGSFVWAEAPL
jgi:hypothetical protein